MILLTITEKMHEDKNEQQPVRLRSAEKMLSVTGSARCADGSGYEFS